MAAHYGDRVLVDVDGHRDAQLLLGEAPFPGLAVAVSQVCVAYVGLVYPDPVAQHNPVLVSVHGGEDPVAPFPGYLVAYAAELRYRLQGDVPAHQPYEVYPGRKVLLAALQDGSSQRVEPASAAAATVPL